MRRCRGALLLLALGACRAAEPRGPFGFQTDFDELTGAVERATCETVERRDRLSPVQVHFSSDLRWDELVAEPDLLLRVWCHLLSMRDLAPVRRDPGEGGGIVIHQAYSIYRGTRMHCGERKPYRRRDIHCRVFRLGKVQAAEAVPALREVLRHPAEVFALGDFLVAANDAPILWEAPGARGDRVPRGRYLTRSWKTFWTLGPKRASSAAPPSDLNSVPRGLRSATTWSGSSPARSARSAAATMR